MAADKEKEEAKKEEKGKAAESDAESAAPKPKPPLLLLLNSLVILAAFGFLFYTKMVYKKPQFTEEGERQKLALAEKSTQPVQTVGLIPFEALTVNIASNPLTPRPGDGTPQQIQGKLHYLTLAFSFEVRDLGQKDEFERYRPIFMDRIISILGRKQFHELSSVQGRYVLRAQLIEMANQLLAKDLSKKNPYVTGMFFTQFVVQ